VDSEACSIPSYLGVLLMGRKIHGVQADMFLTEAPSFCDLVMTTIARKPILDRMMDSDTYSSPVIF
jgi:hypothetical protein